MRLIRFGLENYRSFRDAAELSFVSTSQRESRSMRIESGASPHGLLPAVAIFGANASGKSNLVRAITEFREHVATSFGRVPESPIPWTPWQLDTDVGAPPTTFFADFELEDVHHQYGFTFRDRRYEAEWLHRWPRGQRQVLFERTSGEEPYYFGPSLAGEKKRVADQTRDNALFLSTAAQLNHALLAPVYSSLTEGISSGRKIQLEGFPIFEPGAAIREPSHADRLRGFLRAADVGAQDFELKRLPSPPQSVAGFTKEASQHFQDLWESLRTIWLTRTGEDGRTWSLPPQFESSGTNVWIARVSDLLAINRGVLVIDELDTSLHPDLCSLLVRQFTQPESNPGGAQIIFTTHERAVMDELRRDQVVFVEKTADGRSYLRAASDFKGLRARDDLKRLHERGQLGGVPFLGHLPPIAN